MSVPTAVGDAEDADVQAAFAATLVDEWVRCGVAHAVVCPGSRSTPLAVALAARPAMAVHVRLDERSAAFTALGMGRAGGHPALVVTTSGTAAAELHAAVVEADLAGVPLIACTADRPPELRDVGAPQTIDQTHLFGRSVRWFCDPGVPSDATRGSWRSLAARSVAEATAGAGGPGAVHLNLPFREPLLGDPAAGGGASPGRPDGLPWHQVVHGRVPPPEGVVRDLYQSGRLDPGRRGLIVAGAGCGEPEAVLALSDALGWPVLAEPRSGARVPRPGVIGAADAILRSGRFARHHVPETVLQLGEPWVSKVVNGFLSSAVAAGAEAVTVEPWGRWRDPGRETSLFVRSDPALFSLAAASWAAADGSGSRDAGQGGAGAPSGRRPSRRPGRSSPDSASGPARVAPGARSPSRHWPTGCSPGCRPAPCWWCRRPCPSGTWRRSPRRAHDPPRVLANRGANGIDGVVSTALGVALASSAPTVALVGDLAFLHDVSALVRAEGLTAPLTVVVADNDGGGIFSFLDPARALDAGSFDTLFGTPQLPDVASVAAGFGWPVDECGPAGGPAGFEDVLDRRLAGRSMSVMRIGLPGRDENVAVHHRINAAVVEAIER